MRWLLVHVVAIEALDIDSGAQLRREDLDGHLPSQRRFLSDEYACHPTAREFPFENVGGTECGLQLVADLQRHSRFGARIDNETKLWSPS